MLEKDNFLETLREYTKQQGWLSRIFEHVHRQRIEGRRSWPHMLLFRLYTMSDTLLTLCAIELRNETDVCVLDIASIGAVIRSLVESFVLFSHVSDPDISEEQWAMLELHDATSRYRLLKAIGDKHTEEARALRHRSDALKRSIVSNPRIKMLDPKRQEKLLDGTQLYINGLRDAVRRAGLDRDHFDAMYNFLSSLAHSQPSSVYRTGDGFEATVASEHSYSVADIALNYATGVLDLTCRRTFLIYPEVFLKDVPKH